MLQPKIFLKKNFLFVFFLFLSLLTFTGCGKKENTKTGIGKNYQLTDNTYYVVHDGVYYPILLGYQNEAATDDINIDGQTDVNRMQFFSTSEEENIPTLYKGDKLVYYSTSNVLDHIEWERYYDMGYTIGINGILSTTANHCYVSKDSDDAPFLPESELYKLSKKSSTYFAIEKIGPTQLTPEMLDHGIVTNLKKDQLYDVDIYEGTQYKHYQVTANYHAFHAYELYASINYKAMQDYLYEIEIPDYFLSGYYNIDNLGMFRYVADGTSYDNNTNFNEPLLYQSDGEYDAENSEDYVYTYTPPFCYSECEELNYFSTDIVDAFGYQSEETNDLVTNTPENDKPVSKTFLTSIVNTYELELPNKSQCKIEIKSDEKTGKMTVIFENGTTKEAVYDYFNGTYELELDGKGEHVTLSIEGFYKGYDVDLTNAKLIKKQTNGEEQ